MPARELIYYPDPRLRAVAQPVTRFDADLRALADDLLETLAAVSAIGLTAVHLGLPQRVAIIRLQPDLAPVLYVNPEIAAASAETASHQEGSVSMPGVMEPVERPAAVTVRYRDLDGAAQEEQAEGFLAACLQHEIDQLDGVFWIERLTRLRRERALKRYAKLRRTAG
ncbi:peptide deformylase [Methylobacterium organophilum]|uniref:Peptide deformylase-like n=1 Tax=Methylobacterium organophilum TaxID=410 RepID=A0ABQ4T7A8_METOR|nr:peptide deformylase [Methylobacterium organophilum]GJE27128.1 Peptide deformylase [Methylobacterium organophilum]